MTGAAMVLKIIQKPTAATLNPGANYTVTVASQPPGEMCTVVNGSGTITSANVGNAGSLVTDLAKFTTPKDDQSGDKTVREMLRQLAERSNFMAPVSPKKR